jgi:hypothetical protein
MARRRTERTPLQVQSYVLRLTNQVYAHSLTFRLQNPILLSRFPDGFATLYDLTYRLRNLTVADFSERPIGAVNHNIQQIIQMCDDCVRTITIMLSQGLFVSEEDDDIMENIVIVAINNIRTILLGSGNPGPAARIHPIAAVAPIDSPSAASDAAYRESETSVVPGASYYRNYSRPVPGPVRRTEYRITNHETRTIANSILYNRAMIRLSIDNFAEVQQAQSFWITSTAGGDLQRLENAIQILNKDEFRYQHQHVRSAHDLALVAQHWIVGFMRSNYSFGPRLTDLIEQGVAPMMDDILSELDFLLSFFRTE